MASPAKITLMSSSGEGIGARLVFLGLSGKMGSEEPLRNMCSAKPTQIITTKKMIFFILEREYQIW